MMNWTQAEEERLRKEAEQEAKLKEEWEKKWATIRKNAQGKSDMDYIGELPNHHFEANHKYDYIRMQMGAQNLKNDDSSSSSSSSSSSD